MSFDGLPRYFFVITSFETATEDTVEYVPNTPGI